MRFSPIAIVARACVLPGALTPAQLWQTVAESRLEIGPVPEDRWRLSPTQALCSPDTPIADRSWSDRGGYVREFESVWNPNGFAIAASEFADLDPLVLWTLHCAREALQGCRHGDGRRTGAVFGNLGFPSGKMADYAQAVWLNEAPGDARNRFMSSGTADVLRQALALDAGSHCLDAACASSLYAIKLACDRLHEGSADVMLAGAVQGADDLFLHMGFCALNALSRTGQSRPFHADADGLIPAEGAAFFALKRLADARRDGDIIHGVIRGIGLSNDGRGKGLLVPTEEGQQRAMRAAYDSAGFGPEKISLLECHATGTPVGDGIEIASTAAVFAACKDVPIGSLKANLGHLITTAGAAGLIKILEAMRVGQRPPNLPVDVPTEALKDRPFRLLQQLEDWPSTTARIAAISAFGFGGNNAHLIVSEDDASLVDLPSTIATIPMAIVGLGVMAACAENRDAFCDALFSGRDCRDNNGEGRMSNIVLDLDGLRFPPRDLEQTLPQQLAILQTSREALADIKPLPRERTGVFIGMEPDPEVARYGARWRMANAFADVELLKHARDNLVPALESPAVLGTMPNIPANRLSSQFDFAGPAFTVQAGEASGLIALRVAMRALARNEIDAALVGAVDMSCEAVQRQARRQPPGDAAISIVLKRLVDAQRDGDHIVARVDFDEHVNDQPAAIRLGTSDASIDLASRFGTAYAAYGLLHVAAAALCLQQGCDLDGEPHLEHSKHQVDIEMSGAASLRLSAIMSSVCGLKPTSRLFYFSGTDKEQIIATLIAGEQSLVGPMRLVLVAEPSRFNEQREKALAHLRIGAPAGKGIFFCERAVVGAMAFAFAGAGASYHGMGRALLRQYPQLLDHLRERSQRLPSALAWVFGDDKRQPSALEQLWGASALSQLHLEFSQEILGLRADAWMGYSSGETNALVASGIWRDADALMSEMETSGLVTHLLGGEFSAIEKQWNHPVQWASWTVLAPLANVQSAMADVPRVHIAIINGDNDCLIAGDAQSCATVVARLGESRCLRLDYPLAVHVPELACVASEWLQLHRRETFPATGQIYSNAFGKAYLPDSETCAQAILQQADRVLDLRPAVLSAWNDGVRVFIEHGPGGAYSRAIRNILGEREAVVVSLDRKGQGMDGVLAAVAALLAAGISIRPEFLLSVSESVPTQPSRRQTFAAHWPDIVPPPALENLMASDSSVQRMVPAPLLPSVFSEPGHVNVVIRKPITPAMTISQTPISTPVVQNYRVEEAARSEVFPNPMLAQYQTQLAQLVQTQKHFVAQQTQLHQRYLALQSSSMQVLMRAANNTGANVATATAVSTLPNVAFAQPTAPAKPIATTLLIPPISPASATLVAPSLESSQNTDSTVEHRTSAPVATSQRTPKGLTFTREQLEIHSGGRVADLFGEAFTRQEHFHRQVRMPLPPLLLADRVIGLDAVADSMGKGVIWTETDVCWDSWYLHDGYMPAGVMIEAGQADLMLISYLGVDKFNRSERVYRLLGCELTYHGDLPHAGDTIRFEIELDGHAAQGDVRLMFFHYDCINGDRPQLSVRKGQAGFFTDAELAESAGCLWSAEQQTVVANPRLDPPVVKHVPLQLQRAQLEALAANDAFACFGTGFEFAQTHTRTPGLQAGKMLLQDRVTDISSTGGPWQRGYLRAELDIEPSQWFFDGHFKNDPCMPGTLMFEGCLQAMAIYLAAQGHTLERDGWRFQPVPEIPYQLQCRGQVTPTSRLLVTEVFVEEIIAGPIPTVYADLLCTVDGLKAFHARRVALQLVPDWPLSAIHGLRGIRAPAHQPMSAIPELLLSADHKNSPIAVVDGFAFDQKSLLACAIGKPSDAFGPIYTRFDGPQRVARLPAPPYLFMSRISDVQGPIGVMKAGARVVAEYDVPQDAWYYDANGCRSMAFAVLLEAALQPCGWLSSYVGSALTETGELGFRNLDGDGQLLAELFDDCGTLTTEVTLTDVSATGGMIIENFAVRCFLGTREVYSLKTVFGFFPPAALANQAGLRTSAELHELLARPSDVSINLAEKPEAYFSTQRPKLADGMLLMLDRVDGFWPHAGAAGLGQLRAVKDIDCSEWFFKAHFFQDPVQPGSLGLEAMIQALQFFMLHTEMDRGVDNARFEPIALARTHRWKYRGQVLPKHSRVHTTLEITETGLDDCGVYALANASLWADGQRIYEMEGLGMRIVSA